MRVARGPNMARPANRAPRAQGAKKKTRSMDLVPKSIPLCPVCSGPLTKINVEQAFQRIRYLAEMGRG